MSVACRPVRIALLTEIPAPYRVPLFNTLAASPGVELEVLFLAREDPRRGYQAYEAELRCAWRILAGRPSARGARWTVWSVGAARALERLRPDIVIVGGWNQPAFWEAALWARLRRVPLVVWVESTLTDARSGSRPAEAAKRLMARAAAAFVVPGPASAEYLATIGVAPERVVVAPNAVDHRVFAERVDEARRDREALRSTLGLTRFTVLYVGRLASEKGLDALLEAVRQADVHLVAVGSGPEEARLRTAAPPGVRFPGWLDRDALPVWYAAADAFVLPSLSEPWGMVLNEAAAAGLPIVASTAVGAARELVEDGGNGLLVPPGDAQALAAALRRLAGDDAFRAAASRRSREIARRFTPEAWAAAVVTLASRLAHR